MATITSTLTITAPASTATPAGPLSIALSLTATDTPTTDGKVTCDIYTVTDVHTAAANPVLDASAYTNPVYVYIKNTSDTVIYLCTGDAASAGNQVMEIGASEFAFFPWAAEVDYFLEAASGSKTCEVWTFAQGA